MDAQFVRARSLRVCARTLCAPPNLRITIWISAYSDDAPAKS
jgi:hypothetical protein